MTKKTIAVLPGDGIGPEVTRAAIQVLESIGRLYDHEFVFREGLIGGSAIDEKGDPLPLETREISAESDGILLGAVGGPEWDHLPGDQRPEQGLLGIRKMLDLYANLRPVKAYEALIDASPLKTDIVAGVDFMIVRELTGGLYFGEPKKRETIDGEEQAIDTLAYKQSEIKRIAERAFEAARVREGKVLSVDKANVLESSRLWRETVTECAETYPDITLEHMLVDNAAMQLIAQPTAFDVIVTENTFGDILSDEASMLTGSLGLLPSASLGATGIGLYEPVHGSAPDIAGKNRANPLAAIASAAMMLKYGLQMEEEATRIENALEKVLEAGYRTADITESTQAVTTTEMTEAVVKALE
ncbi:3-isopropylmalate dehydrogenase [Natribacillus halophilus]|uniref:3-isopropylmalate dehydrogenase n=1 Tax=Natribacillus halophilus TaxID=549003 RepID=A0A1G8LSW3_9BACI|nr:3-isopropylmalate dehydrogenase [Natribacillus halophilus]SDI58801.1 3-isopropylmalate dehydrogenase [Natribacillus halophilus]